MKAMVYHTYGSPDVLELQEIEVPAVKDDELLIRVHAASVNWIDWHFLTGTPFLARTMAGLVKPRQKILGIDMAGRVERVGSNIKDFRPCDDVFGGRSGSYAEYVCVREKDVQLKPHNITFEEAAGAGGATYTALRGLRDVGQIRAGQAVVINGASGGVGTFAVQIAKALGAQVTAICSTRNLDLVRSIGADQAIDYSHEGFTLDGSRYDLVFDTVAKLPFSECEHALVAGGVYVTTEFSPVLALVGLWRSATGDKKMVPLPPKPPRKADRILMRKLLESGKVTPVIDKRYSLSELPEALRYLAEGHARGKVIITI